MKRSLAAMPPARAAVGNSTLRPNRSGVADEAFGNILIARSDGQAVDRSGLPACAPGHGRSFPANQPQMFQPRIWDGRVALSGTNDPTGCGTFRSVL